MYLRKVLLRAGCCSGSIADMFVWVTQLAGKMGDSAATSLSAADELASTSRDRATAEAGAGRAWIARTKAAVLVSVSLGEIVGGEAAALALLISAMVSTENRGPVRMMGGANAG